MFWRKKPPEPKRFYCIVKGYEHPYVDDGAMCLMLNMWIEDKDRVVISQEGRKSLVRFLDYGEV